MTCSPYSASRCANPKPKPATRFLRVHLGAADGSEYRSLYAPGVGLVVAGVFGFGGEFADRVDRVGYAVGGDLSRRKS